MDQDKTDLMMQFVLKGKPVSAECSLDVHSNDKMMGEFAKHTSYRNHSNFFEVSNFQMGLNLTEDDQSNSAVGPHAHLHGKPAHAHPANTRIAGRFARWRSATPDEGRDILYPLEVDKFSFDRLIDAASPIFFASCCDSTTFDKAVLVKRISQGQVGGTPRPSVGYLRLVFTDVLITSINWDDGEMVKEQCEFVCQKLEIRYRQQAFEGSVGAPMFASWPTPRSQSIRSKAGKT